MSVTDHDKLDVWYAAYGSNLDRSRFRCYIRGGTPVGSTRDHPGCRDRTPPTEDRPQRLPHRMYFAGRGRSWGGGGVAFLSDAAGSGVAYARLYRIRWQQFLEVLMQENEVDDEAGRERIWELFRHFDPTGGTACLDLPSGLYPRVLRVGARDGAPIWTFTTARDRSVELRRPSRRYLLTLVHGLAEMEIEIAADTPPGEGGAGYDQAWIDDRARYLSEATGGSWSEAAVRSLFRSSVLSVGRTLDRDGAGRSFVAQLRPEQRDELGLKYQDHVLLKAPHSDKTVLIQARLHEPERHGPEPGAVNLDQKLRQALSVTPGDRVLLIRAPRPREPLAWPTRLGRALLQRWGATQAQIMRVTLSTYEDMETHVCRIPASGFDVLGIEPGDHVVVESPTVRLRLRALEASHETIDQREKLAAGGTARELDCAHRLAFDRLDARDRDLPLVFIDLDARDKLGVEPCDAVYVERDVARILWRQVRYMVLSLVLGGTLLIFQLDNDDPLLQAGLLGALLGVGLALLVFEIRKRIT